MDVIQIFPPVVNGIFIISYYFNNFNSNILGRGSKPWGTESYGSCAFIMQENTNVWIYGSLILRTRKGSFTSWLIGKTYNYAYGWVWLKNWYSIWLY